MKLPRDYTGFHEITLAFIHARPTQTWSLGTTYGLKHDLEKAIGFYVSNGELIAAMLVYGYHLKFSGDSINCEYRMAIKAWEHGIRVLTARMERFFGGE